MVSTGRHTPSTRPSTPSARLSTPSAGPSTPSAGASTLPARPSTLSAGPSVNRTSSPELSPADFTYYGHVEPADYPLWRVVPITGYAAHFPHIFQPPFRGFVISHDMATWYRGHGVNLEPGLWVSFQLRLKASNQQAGQPTHERWELASLQPYVQQSQAADQQPQAVDQQPQAVDPWPQAADQRPRIGRGRLVQLPLRRGEHKFVVRVLATPGVQWRIFGLRNT
ncbi:hypothetical protein P389DRAFT_195800 [Cystobasidium minutum MCA 4210]|uniref:uncharacterized protein n=1 Tax=Cystobasidium minutum MCA 4210 TaxID=1397322 RepID=UPI0034CD2E62|eukprot:jgi/Rhomi1/195800/gm1.4014_g